MTDQAPTGQPQAAPASIPAKIASALADQYINNLLAQREQLEQQLLYERYRVKALEAENASLKEQAEAAQASEE